MKSVAILGSTGSIGTQALEVVEKHGMRVTALAAHSRADLLAAQVRRFHPEMVCIYREDKAEELRSLLEGEEVQILTGMDGLCRIAG